MFVASNNLKAKNPILCRRMNPKRRCLDTGKVERLVGWKPTVCFEEGLERTIMWFVPKNAAYRWSGKNGKNA